MIDNSRAIPNSKSVDEVLAWQSQHLSLSDIRRRTADWNSEAILENPHFEPEVVSPQKASAGRAAVSIILRSNGEQSLIVTRRSSSIRFGGQICFPGGRKAEGDESSLATALRETEEEIGISEKQLEHLGCLGTYYTQSGFTLSPHVFLTSSESKLRADPSEVAAIYEVPLRAVQDKGSYRLVGRGNGKANFQFLNADVQIGGPTVSLMIHLMRCLNPFRL